MNGEAIAALRTACSSAGLDIVHPFRVDRVNASLDPPSRLSDWGRPDALGLVIGNTRHLWPVFIDILRKNPELLESDHPLDTYIEGALTKALAETVSCRYAISWAHHTTPAAVPVQRIAQASGLAHLSPSHLSIHPVHGPWMALRAVVVVDAQGSAGEASAAYDPCTPCSKPCLDALQRALEHGESGGAALRHWESWAVVRQVCPEGVHARYDEEQLRYHYAKDGQHLRSVVLTRKR
jgi:cyanocobalamin reductase (cyanide-eliminating) / alkylcobalamin dealkylase